MHKVVNRVVLIAAAAMFVFASSAQAQSAHDLARQAVADGDLTKAAQHYDQALKDAPTDHEVLVEAGDVNMELERYNVARQLYERAVKEERKDAASNRKLALALSALGMHEEAIEAVRLAIKYDDEAMENYLALSEVYLGMGKDSLSRAEQTAMAARAKFPDAAEPYLALGDNYYARGVFELAMTQYEEAIKRNETLIEPRVRLGRSYREMAKRSTDRAEANEYYNKALQEFNNVTRLNPKIARPWYEQGEIFLLAERYQDAGTSFENYVKLRPEDPRGDLMLSRAAFGGRYYQVAVAPLERVLSRTDSVSALYHDQARAMLAKSYYAVKDYPKAKAMYAILPDSVFNDKETTQFYASTMLMTGDTAKALDLYLRLVTANPDDCTMSLQLGDQLYKAKRYDQVIDVFTRRLASCPDEPKSSPYLFIGLSQFTQKRYDEAIAALNSSVAADSTKFQPLYWLMNAYAAKKEFGKAADVARAMTRRDFGDDAAAKTGMATAYFFIGIDAFQSKNFKATIDAMDKATKLKQDYADAYLYSGFAYHSLTDKDNACRFYKLTLKYSPKHPDAQKNLKSLGCD